ncbi:MAG: hypothetical protein H6727_19985 [Myxococcales bacterium]|nr:hypothetical protein [Myxococcales bacterium]
MAKIYLAVVLGTIVSFFADVAPFGGCCGGNNRPDDGLPTEKPKDARLQTPHKSPLAKKLTFKKSVKKSLKKPA